ncbi:MAG: selenium metabolism-associated LysR family transcriptional regulator [Nitrospirota bacterium]
MEDHKLKAFCLIVELKSFSKAAEAKFMTQSAMSHLVRSLEDEIGVSLLNRKGKNVLPTPAGRIFYEHARNILNQYKKMESDIYTLMQKVRGRLTIGAGTTVAAYLLPQVFYSFTKTYPEVEINLSVSNSDDIIQEILDGKLDLGIIEGKTESEHVFLEEIAEDEIVLIASDDNQLAKKAPVTERDLSKQTFIMPETGSGIREAVDEYLRLLKIDVESLRIAMTLGSPELIVQMVQSGMGIAFVSKWSVFRAIKDGTVCLITVPGKKLSRKFYYVSLEKELQSMAARTFLEFVKGYQFFVPF